MPCTCKHRKAGRVRQVPLNEMSGSYYVYYLPPDSMFSTWHYVFYRLDCRQSDMPDIREFVPIYIFDSETGVFEKIRPGQITLC